MLRNTRESYGLVSIMLHWLMAAALLAMFALGYWMTTLSYYDRWYHDAPAIHKSVGMLLLLLLVIRLLWRWSNPRPALIGAQWEQVLALGVHRLHYLLIATVLISGYLIPTAEGVGIDLFGWLSVPALPSLGRQQADLAGQLHRLAAWAMIGLTGLHAAAALKHHLIDRDATLMRMLGIRHTTGGKV